MKRIQTVTTMPQPQFMTEISPSFVFATVVYLVFFIHVILVYDASRILAGIVTFRSECLYLKV